MMVEAWKGVFQVADILGGKVAPDIAESEVDGYSTEFKRTLRLRAELLAIDEPEEPPK